MVSQQTRRRRFAAIVPDLRAVLRCAAGRDPEPTAALVDRRTIPSSPEGGGRAGSDGSQWRKGPKVDAAVDRLGHLITRSSGSRGPAAPGPRPGKRSPGNGRPGFPPINPSPGICLASSSSFREASLKDGACVLGKAFGPRSWANRGAGPVESAKEWAMMVRRGRGPDVFRRQTVRLMDDLKDGQPRVESPS